MVESRGMPIRYSDENNTVKMPCQWYVVSSKKHDLFPDFGSDVLYDVPPTHVDKFRLLHSRYSSVAQFICEFNIAIF